MNFTLFMLKKSEIYIGLNEIKYMYDIQFFIPF